MIPVYLLPYFNTVRLHFTGERLGFESDNTPLHPQYTSLPYL
ncbi:hypothetical protein HNQ69_001448 [Bartonella callosciuri]|uniref:Uncharacterized protein n=1 Tax=Bartonella callosciuri TaxID=686223 RepID=A0A840NR37_9HYPH|nr:hypothetical protein [Bartonella callosciuri]